MAYSHELGAEASLLLEHGATPIFLQHPCSRNQRLLCSLFKTSKQVSAIIEVPCSRLLEATYKPLAAKHPQRGDMDLGEWLAKSQAIANSAELSAHMQLFTTWLDKHRASVKQLDLYMPDYDPQLLGELQQLLGKHGGLVKALKLGQGRNLLTKHHLAATAAALQGAAGLQLQSLHIDYANPTVLQHLPASSLTSLRISCLVPGDGHSTSIPQALAALSNLRMLHLSLDEAVHNSFRSSVVNALSRLTRLTKLDLGELKTPDLPHMRHLPTQLLELGLEVNEVWYDSKPLCLGQLSALTRFCCSGADVKFANDVLPPNLVHLELACRVACGAPLQRLTKLRELLMHECHMPAADLCSVAAHLTNLTRLDLQFVEEGVLTQAAAAFPFLPGLSLRVKGNYSNLYVDHTIVLSSSVIQQISKAKGLQSLTLEDVHVEAIEADFRAVLQQRWKEQHWGMPTFADSYRSDESDSSDGNGY